MLWFCKWFQVKIGIYPSLEGDYSGVRKIKYQENIVANRMFYFLSPSFPLSCNPTCKEKNSITRIPANCKPNFYLLSIVEPNTAGFPPALCHQQSEGSTFLMAPYESAPQPLQSYSHSWTVDDLTVFFAVNHRNFPSLVLSF